MKGKMMIKRLKTYQPKWYVELCKKVRSPCCRHPDNDKVIDYALRKAREARIMYACSHCGGQLEDYGHPDVHTHWCPHCNLPAILRNGRWIGTRQGNG